MSVISAIVVFLFAYDSKKEKLPFKMNYCWLSPVISPWTKHYLFIFQERTITKPFAKRAGTKWTSIVVTILTLFCLAQNSGLFNLALNLDRAQGTTADPLSVLYSAAFKPSVIKSSTIDGDSDFKTGVPQSALSDAAISGTNASEISSSTAESFEFKRCELSEKSMRLCLEDSSVVALLVLLFLLPLSPSFVMGLNRVTRKVSFVRVRRIHLTLCRFQE